jgi:hypothetical protein
MRKALLAVALWAIPSLAQAQGVPIQDLPLATTPLSSSDLFAVTQGNVFHKLPGTSLGLAAGLGTMSTQNANAVAITGGTISGVTIAGNVTGHASLDLALTGGTMLGNIAMGGNDISGGGMFAATTLTGTLSTAAQPNITSVGTLAGLTVTGSFTATGLVSNADIANPATTVNGQTCTLGSTCTVTATAGNALTFGTHLTGGSFNGSAPVTLGTDATSANTVSTIVARDGSGNFAAGAITLTGNPVYGISGATTNGNCVEFGTGSILTDAGAPCSSGGGGGSVTSVGLTVPATSIFGVTGSPITTAGTLGITTTGTSGGIPYFSSTSQLTSSALLASHGVVYGGGAGSAPVTTAAGTNGQILTGQTGAAPAFETMSGDGTFSAAGVLAITNLSGVTNASLANSGLAHSTISGVSLGSNLATLTYGTHLTNSAGASTYNGSAASTLATDATNANTASTIVARDASGNFTAGTITATLTGGASLDLPLTGGTMSGDIAMGGHNISGGGTFTATTLAGTLSTAAQPNVTSLGTVAGLTVTGSLTATGLVTNADLAHPATTVNGQTCTLGSTCTVTATAGSALTFGTHLTGTSYNGSSPVTIATDATDANTNSTIVARDGSGNFTAGTITASLTGHASLDLPLTGGTMSGTITSTATIPLTDTSSVSFFPQLVLNNDASDSFGPYLILTKGRAGNTTTLNGDSLGVVDFEGFGSGNAAAQGPYIQAVSTGSAGTTFIPSDLVFLTATSSAVTEQMRIASTGMVSIPNGAITVVSDYATATPIGGISSHLTNDYPSSTFVLPTAITGFATIPASTSGNQAFGVYGLAELRSTGGGTGIASEFTARNFSGNAPDTNLPPNSAIGTTTSVTKGINVTCGFQALPADCSIGIHIGNEVSDPTFSIFNTGEYIQLYRQYGLFIEAMPSGNQISAVIKTNGVGNAMELLSTAEPSLGGGVFEIVNHSAVTTFYITYGGDFLATGKAVVEGLPTSAGGGGLFVCVDTSGNFYKKAVCP